MAEGTTIAFYTDTDTKQLLEQWAREDDRSVSWVIRRMIEAEKVRRQGLSEPTQWQQNIDAALGGPAKNHRVESGAELISIVS